MALLIYGILENRVLENMKQEEKPLVLAGKRKLFKPTGQPSIIETASRSERDRHPSLSKFSTREYVSIWIFASAKPVAVDG